MVALILGVAAVAPSVAGAFTGESVVLNPGKTDLTGPAKTILTNPTFLPDAVDGASALGGVPEASGAASVVEASTLLPALGAFGLGAVIGSEICHVVGIEGCWQFTGSTGTETAKEYSWEFSTSTYSWRWTRGTALYNTAEASACTTGSQWPSLADHDGAGTESVATECKHGGSEWFKLNWTKRLPLRYSMQGRALGYSASDTAMPNYEPGGKPYEANSKWSEKMASALKGQSDATEAGRFGRHIASKIEGSGVSDPYPHKVIIPSCSGEAWIECKADLEELELKPERKELDWSDAHLDLAPDEVVELEPAPSTQVEVPGTETTVVVTTNPDEAGMPLVIPYPADGETYPDYITKLVPGLNPERHNVGEGFTDPHVGPNAVLRTHPDSGTRLDPSTEHDVEVETNPPDAPPAAAAWTAPAIPALDLSPLSGVSIGCSSFPFGVFCWVADGLTSWGAEGECPAFDVPFTSEIRESTSDLTFDTCTFEPAMDVIRSMLVILSFFGVAWLLSASAMGLGGGASADD